MKMTLPLMVGWKPLRTLKLCSWDGEEHGMLGSTAWGERADGGGATTPLKKSSIMVCTRNRGGWRSMMVIDRSDRRS
jgi:hypothetical protein